MHHGRVVGWPAQQPFTKHPQRPTASATARGIATPSPVLALMPSRSLTTSTDRYAPTRPVVTVLPSPVQAAKLQNPALESQTNGSLADSVPPTNAASASANCSRRES